MSQWKILPEIAHYFVTSSIVYWHPVFLSEPYFEVIIKTLKYCMANKGLHLHGYVIMPNHIHYILSTDSWINLSDVMRDINSHTSKEITSLLRSDKKWEGLWASYRSAEYAGRGNVHKLWQDGFHPIAVETEQFFLEKLNYMHDNPVRKGYVEKAEHWKYSSARNYILDDHGIIQVECL